MKKKDNIIIRIEPELRAEISTQAKKLKMSNSDFICSAVDLLLLVLQELEVKQKFQLKNLIAKMREELLQQK